VRTRSFLMCLWSNRLFVHRSNLVQTHPHCPYIVRYMTCRQRCHPESSQIFRHPDPPLRLSKGEWKAPRILPLPVLRRCLFLPSFVLAVILSASFEREGPRYSSHPLNPPLLSPQKLPPIARRVAQAPGEGITTTEVGAPGASLLGTWVSAAATPSSETEDFFLGFPRNSACQAPRPSKITSTSRKQKRKNFPASGIVDMLHGV
jgi:hypothetical protein